MCIRSECSNKSDATIAAIGGSAAKVTNAVGAAIVTPCAAQVRLCSSRDTAAHIIADRGNLSISVGLADDLPQRIIGVFSSVSSHPTGRSCCREFEPGCSHCICVAGAVLGFLAELVTCSDIRLAISRAPTENEERISST
jgi:hypothetical protein